MDFNEHSPPDERQAKDLFTNIMTHYAISNPKHVSAVAKEICDYEEIARKSNEELFVTATITWSILFYNYFPNNLIRSGQAAWMSLKNIGYDETFCNEVEDLVVHYHDD